MLASFINIAFAGVAYGVLLFLMSAGLSVTMGLMRFANLAHAAFAMLGGYVTVTLMNVYHWPFLVTLPVAALVTGVVATLLERAIFRRLYGRSQLDQVMLTVGVLFMAVASATFVWGASPLPVQMPAFLGGDWRFGPLDLNVYRIFLVIAGGLVTAALILGFERTSFGAKIRAAVDNRRVTASCGIDVDRLFMLAFFIGSALAGLAGALSINLLGVEPDFAVNILSFVLIVVVLGGHGSMRGTLGAAVLLGVADVVGKYYVPQTGAFIIYVLTVVLLFWRPEGLFARR